MATQQPKIEITKERNVSLDLVRNIGIIAHIDGLNGNYKNPGILVPVFQHEDRDDVNFGKEV